MVISRSLHPRGHHQVQCLVSSLSRSPINVHLIKTITVVWSTLLWVWLSSGSLPRVTPGSLIQDRSLSWPESTRKDLPCSVNHNRRQALVQHGVKSAIHEKTMRTRAKTKKGPPCSVEYKRRQPLVTSMSTRVCKFLLKSSKHVTIHG